MPKVISGKLKGRIIKGYDILGTRPTMDRVKESIFGMIQNYLNESIVLDLFAGSGNLGIESFSNGAKKVYFNDYNKKCLEIIQSNIRDFCIEKDCVLTRMDYQEALNFYHNKKIQFNLVFLDPPYKEHIIKNILYMLVKNNLLFNKALIICEFQKKYIYENDQLILFKEKKYGDKYVVIYQYCEKSVK